MHLWRGVAYVPKSDAFSAVLTRFRKQLEEYMQVIVASLASRKQPRFFQHCTTTELRVSWRPSAQPTCPTN